MSHQCFDVFAEDVQHTLADLQLIGDEHLVRVRELVAVAVVVGSARPLVHFVCSHQIHFVLKKRERDSRL